MLIYYIRSGSLCRLDLLSSSKLSGIRIAHLSSASLPAGDVSKAWKLLCPFAVLTPGGRGGAGDGMGQGFPLGQRRDE
jgi:hypothetical protein